MHTVARRIKQPRWQPYSLPAPHTYLATPASSNSPPSSLLDRKPSPKSLAGIALIERAVNCLEEIWPNNQAESIFMIMPYIQAQQSASSMGSTLSTSSKSAHSTNQLPSPVSPLQRAQASVKSSIIEQVTAHRVDSLSVPVSETVPNPIMPIRSYVHELLRRSRTSLAVLQTALCYVEAAGVHVPAIRQSRASSAFADKPTLTITVSEDHPTTPPPATASIPSLPPAPHPLLCARRTFLASLLLAHKFTADKAFSNKAWARLTNLPPREVGRCERALGEALEWRLWVGKPVDLEESTPRTAGLGRTKSAPAAYFEIPNVRMHDTVSGSRALGRTATEPSIGQTHLQHHRPLTYSPTPMAYTSGQSHNSGSYAEASTSFLVSSGRIANGQMASGEDTGSGQLTARVEDDDDIDFSSSATVDLTPAAVTLRGWKPQSSSLGGPSSVFSTPALSPASSVMSGSSSGSDAGCDLGLVPASWVPIPSSMKQSFTMEYLEPNSQHGPCLWAGS